MLALTPKIQCFGLALLSAEQSPSYLRHIVEVDYGLRPSSLVVETPGFEPRTATYLVLRGIGPLFSNQLNYVSILTIPKYISVSLFMFASTNSCDEG